jgi:hypothetical protein
MVPIDPAAPQAEPALCSDVVNAIAYCVNSKGHDANGNCNGGSICYFNFMGWSDWEGGNRYQLAPSSINLPLTSQPAKRNQPPEAL